MCAVLHVLKSIEANGHSVNCSSSSNSGAGSSSRSGCEPIHMWFSLCAWKGMRRRTCSIRARSSGLKASQSVGLAEAAASGPLPALGRLKTA